jgi:hypothetical protein
MLYLSRFTDSGQHPQAHLKCVYSLYKGGLVEDMTSKQLYPCFACRKVGHEVQVFLDGKDEHGRTKYLNEDMTKHTHLGSSNNSSSNSSSSSATMSTLNDKLDRIIALLYGKREMI